MVGLCHVLALLYLLNLLDPATGQFYVALHCEER
jgi:hypothetical protein